MHGITIRWLTLTLAIIVTAYLFEGIHVSGFWSALFAAAVLGILNAFFRPIILLVTLPINILSMGLFTFVINALLLKMASGVISGFNVEGFWPAVFGALLISVVSWLINGFINDRGAVEYIDLRHKGDNRWE
jgi:putative membrane protein